MDGMTSDAGSATWAAPLGRGGLDRAGRHRQHLQRGRLRDVRVTGQHQADGAGSGRDQAGRHQERGRPPAR